MPEGAGPASRTSSFVRGTSKPPLPPHLTRRAATVSAPGGVVASYVHNAVSPGLGAIGVLVAIAPVGAPVPPGSPAAAAATELGRRVAMHVAACKPAFVSREAVPPGAFAAERAAFEEQVRSR